jgi:hypothetical protein
LISKRQKTGLSLPTAMLTARVLGPSRFCRQ